MITLSQPDYTTQQAGGTTTDAPLVVCEKIDLPPIGDADAPPAIAAGHAPANPFVGHILTLPELFAREYKTNWIVQGVIMAQEAGVIFGDPGSGKSFIVLDLLASLAVGSPTWARGRFITPRACRVLYCAGEGEQGIQKRLYAINEEIRRTHGHDIPAEMLFYLPIVPQIVMSDMPDNLNAFCDAVDAMADSRPFDLIVIDTLSQATIGVKDNDNAEMAKVLHFTREAQKRLGSAFLYVHHAGKNADYRGPSTILANTSFMLEVKAEGPGRGFLRYKKSREGRAFPDIGYRLRSVDSPFDEEGTAVVEWLPEHGHKPVWRRVADHIEAYPDRRHTARSIIDETGLPEQQVKNALTYHIDGMIARYDREPFDPTKKKSNRNPWAYQLKPCLRGENVSNSFGNTSVIAPSVITEDTPQFQ